MDPGGRQELDRLVASQLGLVTRQQLQASGLAGSTVRRRARSGTLDQVGRQVFRVPGAPRSQEASVLAACLEVGGVASHRTAVWLHRLGPWPGCVDVMVDRPRNHQPSRLVVDAHPVAVHASTNLPDVDVLMVGAVPSLSVARALLSLAALVPLDVRRSTLDATVGRALDREVASLGWLWAVLEGRRCRGRNGVREFEAVLEQLSDLGPAESWLEREFLRLLATHGYRRPTTQRLVRRRGRFVARVDFCFEEADLVVEVLGHTFHRTREQLAADAARANEIQLAGWRLLQFSYDQVVQSPEATLRTLRDALGGSGGPSPRSVV